MAALVCVVPLLIATGLTATFLRPMALALFLGIVVSMVVAVTVTPALAVLVMAVGPRARTAAGPPTGLAALPARAGAAYRRGVARVAAAPRLAAVCLGLTAAAGVAALAALPFVHATQPQFADRALVMRLSGAPGMSLPELSRMTSLVTGELRTLPSVQSVGATLGRATNSDQVENVNTGELWITLKPDASYGAGQLADHRDRQQHARPDRNGQHLRGRQHDRRARQRSRHGRDPGLRRQRSGARRPGRAAVRRHRRTSPASPARPSAPRSRSRRSTSASTWTPPPGTASRPARSAARRARCSPG